MAMSGLTYTNNSENDYSGAQNESLSIRSVGTKPM